ncbi:MULTISPECIES: hypothetical protein [Deinococcus]|uniref:Uncharacterized protein n=1 Tax=Deinococcus radiotolerans TaxID=1309407 RepID=A0ABQ2FR91_9DEIO|nr:MULTISPECIES: hypothetical protein [Deinococcus]GGB83729.1 hypothetical protein GCM10008019_44760 [Deinococcus soli (ex Cha et al. 2016)]GGL19087.1 hypothetical protein GCM10010844_42580 [Deinococcus radiotolerans]
MTTRTLSLRLVLVLLSALLSVARAETLTTPTPPAVATPDAGGIDDYGLE